VLEPDVPFILLKLGVRGKAAGSTTDETVEAIHRLMANQESLLAQGVVNEKRLPRESLVGELGVDSAYPFMANLPRSVF
jgi:hypothetical protein